MSGQLPKLFQKLQDQKIKNKEKEKGKKYEKNNFANMLNNKILFEILFDPGNFTIPENLFIGNNFNFSFGFIFFLNHALYKELCCLVRTSY